MFSVIENACLLLRYLIIDVESVTSGMCLPRRCLAVVICVTIWMTRFTQNQVFQHNPRNYKWICSLSHVIFSQAWILCAVELAESNVPVCSFVWIGFIAAQKRGSFDLSHRENRRDTVMLWKCFIVCRLTKAETSVFSTAVTLKQDRHFLWTLTSHSFSIKLMGLFLNVMNILCVWWVVHVSVW
jgi:hypothetical protein